MRHRQRVWVEIGRRGRVRVGGPEDKRGLYLHVRRAGFGGGQFGGIGGVTVSVTCELGASRNGIPDDDGAGGHWLGFVPGLRQVQRRRKVFL